MKTLSFYLYPPLGTFPRTTATVDWFVGTICRASSAGEPSQRWNTECHIIPIRMNNTEQARMTYAMVPATAEY